MWQTYSPHNSFMLFYIVNVHPMNEEEVVADATNEVIADAVADEVIADEAAEVEATDAE